jgi:arylsulfatase A-like enzyme
MLAVAGLLAPLATRLALMIEREVGFSGPDLRGFFSDLVVSLFFFAALLLACRWRRWLGMVLVILWCVLNYGNYEHVTVLGSPAGLAHAGYLADETFLKGSALVPTHPLLLAGILCVSCLLTWFGGRTKSTRGPLLTISAVALVALAIHLVWPLDDEALTWRQVNVVYENLRWVITPLARTPTEEPAHAVPAGVESAIDSLFRADLSGKPILTLGNRGANVLLIMLEGISGVHLDYIAERHGVSVSVKMRRLDRVARENLVFRSFVSHQRQTNRGEYAILCGDYPKLVTDEPKMTEALESEGLICLPSVLRDAGYETVYLQSAPLGFMSKDLFMPRIGFSQVYGEEWFTQAYARNQWGIDDRAYFEQSLEMVKTLKAGQKPWFLTLLTVGTHHPYIVPSGYGSGTFATAAAYLDGAFARFLQSLREMTVLENTLVLITSDESVGISGYRGAKLARAGEGIDDLTKKLSDNWGFLIAMLPTGERMRIDADFMQADLALSVIDYLGLATGTGEFAGRSIFRRYDGKRPIKRLLGALDSSDHLSICPEDFTSCSTYELPDGRLFSPNRTRRETDPTGVEFLKAMVARSKQAKDRPRRLPLLADPIVPISTSSGMQVIFGGQYLSVPAYTRIDVDLEVEVLGQSGSVSLGHILKSGGRNYHFRKGIPPLQPGDHLTVRYSFTPTEPLQYLDCLATARRLSGGEIGLNFKTARLTLVPPGPGDAQHAPGLRIRELQLTQLPREGRREGS